MVSNMRRWDEPPPATPKQIDAWERFFALPMPDDLKSFLLASNGPVLWDAALNKELQTFGAHEAKETYQAFFFNENFSDGIPIALDGCGNFAAYIRRDAEILGVYGVASSMLGDPDATVFLCRSFSELVDLERRIDDCIAAGGA